MADNPDGVTFRAFDVRGEFPRFWDDGRGVDAARVFGSGQLDAIKAIGGAEGFFDSALYMAANQGPVANRVHPITRDVRGNVTANVSGTSGPETRPRNVAFSAMLKF